ncbi:ATP-binding protein [Clostridium formicaceticum]|uniref:Transposase n=1 Tax=Clostridium formicaceticum TaxID=1497 RepID=A0AAC9RKG1_9CLOT|nr:ATP-binding protein [Clostridium formicaceticum]AOY76251.1 hypothetical protein BJL90_10265 [Clostridium formicaceticum]ARE86633.1 transposase [Clostridium formicaceticum]
MNVFKEGILIDNNHIESLLKKFKLLDMREKFEEEIQLAIDKKLSYRFFQLIRQRYEKSSLTITTNLPLGLWDEIFTSKLAATAILDRLVHHCHIISITGDSYRSSKGKKLKGHDLGKNSESIDVDFD